MVLWCNIISCNCLSLDKWFYYRKALLLTVGGLAVFWVLLSGYYCSFGVILSFQSCF